MTITYTELADAMADKNVPLDVMMRACVKSAGSNSYRRLDQPDPLHVVLEYVIALEARVKELERKEKRSHSMDGSTRVFEDSSTIQLTVETKRA